MPKKSKSKPEAQTTAAAATESVSATTVSDVTGVPLLSADALSKLTQTIQTNFGKVKANSGKGKNNNRKKVKKGVKDLPVRKPADKPILGKKANQRKQDDKTKNQVGETNGTRGKKRARDTDELKPQQLALVSKAKPVTPNGTGKDVLPRKPEEKGKKIGKEALLKEIIELGGTQEDLDLMNDIGSGSEIEETEFNVSGKVVKGFRNDLAGFMKEIGLEGGRFDATADGDEEEDAELEEGDEDGDEDEDMEEAEAPKIAHIPTAPIISDPKLKGSKLVIPL